AAGRDDVGTAVAVEVADDQIFRIHAAVVDELLRFQRAFAIDRIDRQARLAAAPADRELVVAVAVEIGPAERVPLGQRGFDGGLRPQRRARLLGVNGDAGAVPRFDGREQPASADASELDLAGRSFADHDARPRAVLRALPPRQSFV